MIQVKDFIGDKKFILSYKEFIIKQCFINDIEVISEFFEGIYKHSRCLGLNINEETIKKFDKDILKEIFFNNKNKNLLVFNPLFADYLGLEPFYYFDDFVSTYFYLKNNNMIFDGDFRITLKNEECLKKLMDKMIQNIGKIDYKIIEHFINRHFVNDIEDDELFYDLVKNLTLFRHDTYRIGRLVKNEEDFLKYFKNDDWSADIYESSNLKSKEIEEFLLKKSHRTLSFKVLTDEEINNLIREDFTLINKIVSPNETNKIAALDSICDFLL